MKYCTVNLNRHGLKKTKLQAERGHAKQTPMIQQSGIRRAVWMLLLTKIKLKVTRTKCPKGRKTPRKDHLPKAASKARSNPRHIFRIFNLVEVHKWVQKVKENPEKARMHNPIFPHLVRSLPHLVRSLLHQALWFPTLPQMSHKVVQISYLVHNAQHHLKQW